MVIKYANNTDINIDIQSKGTLSLSDIGQMVEQYSPSAMDSGRPVWKSQICNTQKTRFTGMINAQKESITESRQHANSINNKLYICQNRQNLKSTTMQ